MLRAIRYYSGPMSHYRSRSPRRAAAAGGPSNPLRFVVRVARRYRQEHFAQLSASLAYTTLLSLVPLVTIALVVVSSLPFYSTLLADVQKVLFANLLPDKAGVVVTKYALLFSQKATKLTLVGLGFLLLTTLLLAVSIERAFNHVWRVGKGRSLAGRVKLFGVMLILGPAALTLGFGVVTFALSLSLGWFSEGRWLRQWLFSLLAWAAPVGMFFLLYWRVPNAPVRWVDALFGAVAATLGLALLQRLFAWYLASFPSYTLVYGAFAAVPIFLLWLYLTWNLVLIGALVAATRGGVGEGARAD